MYSDNFQLQNNFRTYYRNVTEFDGIRRSVFQLTLKSLIQIFIVMSFLYYSNLNNIIIIMQ